MQTEVIEVSSEVSEAVAVKVAHGAKSDAVLAYLKSTAPEHADKSTKSILAYVKATCGEECTEPLISKLKGTLGMGRVKKEDAAPRKKGEVTGSQIQAIAKFFKEKGREKGQKLLTDVLAFLDSVGGKEGLEALLPQYDSIRKTMGLDS